MPVATSQGMGCSRPMTGAEGRVEMWRGGVGRAYPLAGPFVCRCLTSPPVLRLHIPLIEPDVRISRIRLSDKGVHAFAHGRLRVSSGRRMRPRVPYSASSG